MWNIIKRCILASGRPAVKQICRFLQKKNDYLNSKNEIKTIYEIN